MQISIKNYTGKIFTLSGLHSGLISEVKKEIFCKTSIPPDQQRLTFADKQLEDGNSLWFYDVGEGAMLEVQHLGSFNPTSYLTSYLTFYQTSYQFPT